MSDAGYCYIDELKKHEGKAILGADPSKRIKVVTTRVFSTQNNGDTAVYASQDSEGRFYVITNDRSSSDDGENSFNTYHADATTSVKRARLGDIFLGGTLSMSETRATDKVVGSVKAAVYRPVYPTLQQYSGFPDGYDQHLCMPYTWFDGTELETNAVCNEYYSGSATQLESISVSTIRPTLVNPHKYGCGDRFICTRKSESQLVTYPYTSGSTTYTILDNLTLTYDSAYDTASRSTILPDNLGDDSSTEQRRRNDRIGSYHAFYSGTIKVTLEVFTNPDAGSDLYLLYRMDGQIYRSNEVYGLQAGVMGCTFSVNAKTEGRNPNNSARIPLSGRPIQGVFVAIRGHDGSFAYGGSISLDGIAMPDAPLNVMKLEPQGNNNTVEFVSTAVYLGHLDSEMSVPDYDGSELTLDDLVSMGRGGVKIK